MKPFDLTTDSFAKIPLIIDQRIFEELSTGGPRAIDRLLLPEIRNLKNEYKRMGNPSIIYLAGNSLSDVVSSMPRCNESFQFSKLQSLMAEMLLSQGSDAHSLILAIHHLDIAIDVLQRVETISEHMIRTHVSYVLQLTVTYKALGHFDYALKLLDSSSKLLITGKSATPVDLVPLKRQEIMMHQTIEGHRQLLEHAVIYKKHEPLEYYRSLKRVFEFLLNNGGIRQANTIFTEFNKAFISISNQVDPISQISFMKNIGHYHLCKNEIKKASGILNEALTLASQCNLQGQVRQIIRLLQEIDTGNNIAKLETFTITS